MTTMHFPLLAEPPPQGEAPSNAKVVIPRLVQIWADLPNPSQALALNPSPSPLPIPIPIPTPTPFPSNADQGGLASKFMVKKPCRPTPSSPYACTKGQRSSSISAACSRRTPGGI